LLDRDAAGPGALFLGAGNAEKNVVGLLVGAPNESRPGSLTVCHLWVSPSYRGLGIERTLLAECERSARERSCFQMEMELLFFSRTKQLFAFTDAPALLALFRDMGWGTVKFCKTSFYIRDRRLMSEPWFQLRLPEGYEIFAWTQLRPGDRAAVEARGKALREAQRPFLDPWEIDPFDVHTSLGVRRRGDGQVAGWIINKAQSQTHLVFRHLFIMPEERGRGLFHPLLSDSIRRAFDHYSTASFNVLAENVRMKTAMSEMLGHLCDLIQERHYCRKAL